MYVFGHEQKWAFQAWRGMVMEFVEVIPLIFFGSSCMYEAPDCFMSEGRFGGGYFLVDIGLQKCRFNNTW